MRLEADLVCMKTLCRLCAAARVYSEDSDYISSWYTSKIRSARLRRLSEFGYDGSKGAGRSNFLK